MKILVYPHSMETGGSQLNAIELAAAVRNRGHDVLLVSTLGPLLAKAGELKLDHVPIPPDCKRLSLPMLNFLTHLVKDHAIDVVHGYEWPPAIELYFGPRIRRSVPAVCTVMSMAVAPFLPRDMPLIVGTTAIKRRAEAAGHTSVTLLEPPVDTDENAPGFDGAAFRAAHGLSPTSTLIVVVGRLSRELKLEGLLSACDAIGVMAAGGSDVQLAIAGDGPERAVVAQRAAMANARAGRRAVILTGNLTDPRPAYAAAGILLGMGGSALRGMAFGKPLIVQGELGFWRLVTPETCPEFLDAGWYGLGSASAPIGETGLAESASLLQSQLAPLFANPGRQRELGAFGRKLIVDRFSLARAAVLQEDLYTQACTAPRRLDPTQIAKAASGVVTHQLRRKLQRWRGTCPGEDFNAIPPQPSQAAQA